MLIARVNLFFSRLLIKFESEQNRPCGKTSANKRQFQAGAAPNLETLLFGHGSSQSSGCARRVRMQRVRRAGWQPPGCADAQQQRRDGRPWLGRADHAAGVVRLQCSFVRHLRPNQRRRAIPLGTATPVIHVPPGRSRPPSFVPPSCVTVPFRVESLESAFLTLTSRPLFSTSGTGSRSAARLRRLRRVTTVTRPLCASRR